MSNIKERISYVIPIAITEDSFGIPVLVYEVDNWEGKADFSFGVFFIGLRAKKKYILAVKVSSEDGSYIPIPMETEEFDNKKFFQVSEARDGEKIVSASVKVNFSNVKINSPGIYNVNAVLIDGDTREILNTSQSYFDIKPVEMIRDEFR